MIRPLSFIFQQGVMVIIVQAGILIRAAEAEIQAYARHMLESRCQQLETVGGKYSPRGWQGMTSEARSVLGNHHWPGNVPELAYLTK